MRENLAKIIFFSLVSAAVILEIFGDTILKKWALENKNIFLLVGFSVYIIGSIFWVISLKYETLSRAISIFTVLNMLVIVLVGILFFKENLSLLNKLGIALGIASIILLEI